MWYCLYHTISLYGPGPWPKFWLWFVGKLASPCHRCAACHCAAPCCPCATRHRCRSALSFRPLPLSCHLSPCCPLPSLCRPLLCRPLPSLNRLLPCCPLPSSCRPLSSLCRTVVPLVAIVMPPVTLLPPQRAVCCAVMPSHTYMA